MGLFGFATKMAEANGVRGRRTVALNTVRLANGTGLGDFVDAVQTGIEQAIDVFKNPQNHTPLALTGGLTLTEFRELWLKAKQTYAKKQFFNVRIVDFGLPESLGLSEQDDIFNYLAIDVSYSDTVGGQVKNIASYQSDQVTGLERKVFRITFLDRHDGVIERYFKHKKESMFNDDGTINCPNAYSLALGIHKIDVETGQSYLSQGHLVRIESIDYELSRRDGGLIELPVTFVELDKFM